MSDEEVDLNAMIHNDRKRQYEERVKRRQQRQNERRDYRDRRDNRDSYRDNNRRDRSRDGRRDDRRDRRQNQGRRDRRDNYRQSNELVIQSYAISATGFVSDVSLDDILKLAKGKKIINIKAFFEREDGKPLEAGKDNKMSVIINFAEKGEADDFIKEYSDKVLDGSNPLTFQFRRGIVSRQPKRKEESSSEEEGNSGNAKSEEEK